MTLEQFAKTNPRRASFVADAYRRHLRNAPFGQAADLEGYAAPFLRMWERWDSVDAKNNNTLQAKGSIQPIPQTS